MTRVNLPINHFSELGFGKPGEKCWGALHLHYLIKSIQLVSIDNWLIPRAGCLLAYVYVSLTHSNAWKSSCFYGIAPSS